MTLHTCKLCNYSASKYSNFSKHLETIKHKNNLILSQQVNSSNIINKIDKQNDTIQILVEQNGELKAEIAKLKEINNQNTNKIVKEARAIKKSILTILNTNFKDTPSIDYIKEDDFKKELEHEYNCKITDKDNKLVMRIFTDYENKKLIDSLSKIILKIVKKEDQSLQYVFNIDSARGNYATKIEDCWFNDKSGLQLKKYTLEMVIKYMLNVLDKFRLSLVEVRKENIKKPSIDKSDYIMKYQTILLELNAYLTNTNTHKKIILHMCPELRINQNLLECIEKDLN